MLGSVTLHSMSSTFDTTGLCPIREIFPRDLWPSLLWAEKGKGIGFSRRRGSGGLSPLQIAQPPPTFTHPYFFASLWNQLYSKHLKILHMCEQLAFTTCCGCEKPTDMHRRSHKHSTTGTWAMNWHTLVFKHTSEDNIYGKTSIAQLSHVL